MIRADYIVEGYGCLGMVALQRAPLAFLAPEDRAMLLGAPPEYFTSLRDCLPPALTLAEVARIVWLLDPSA